MNKKQKQARKSKMEKRDFNLRKNFFPTANDKDLWCRHIAVGFTTIPRAMTIILSILNSFSSGKPVGATYLALWCHVFDSNMVEIKDPKKMAFESGFQNKRGETTWIGRIKILKELGFIDTKKGSSGEFTYILIYNPYLIIKEKYEKEKSEIPENLWTALFARCQDIGADDLLEPEIMIDDIPF